VNAEPEEIPNDDDEMLLRRKRHRNTGEAITGLNLTAMMDMMTIILVFLIKRYGEAPENITTNDDLKPPLSTSPETLQPAVAVYISQSKIVVDKDSVLEVVDGKVAGGSSPAAFQPVGVALEAKVQQIKILSTTGGSEFNGNVI